MAKKEYGYNVAAGMARAQELGYRSHNGGTCGLHFHVDRVYFRGSMETPEVALAILFQNNREFLIKFSRRKNWHYCHMAADVGNFSAEDFNGKDPEQNLKAHMNLRSLVDYYKARNGYSHGIALNTCGHSTIEFRLFRGTLNPTTFAAALQLVCMMSYAAKHFRKEQLCSVDARWFKRFAKRQGFHEYLKYLEVRKIMNPAA